MNIERVREVLMDCAAAGEVDARFYTRQLAPGVCDQLRTDGCCVIGNEDTDESVTVFWTFPTAQFAGCLQHLYMGVNKAKRRGVSARWRRRRGRIQCDIVQTCMYCQRTEEPSGKRHKCA